MTDLTSLENQLATNNELLGRIYVSLLFIIGVTAAAFVIYLLYKAIRKFF